MQVTYNNALDVWEQIKNVVPEDTAKSFGPVLNPMVWNEYGKNEEITSLIETLIHEINENLELNNISLEEKKSKTKKVGGREFVITKTANRIKSGKGGKKQVAIKFEDKVVDIPKFTYKNAINLWGDFRIKRHIMNIIHDVDFQNQLESLMARSWDKYGKNKIVTKAIDKKLKTINEVLKYKNSRIKSGKATKKQVITEAEDESIKRFKTIKVGSKEIKLTRSAKRLKNVKVTATTKTVDYTLSNIYLNSRKNEMGYKDVVNYMQEDEKDKEMRECRAFGNVHISRELHIDNPEFILNSWDGAYSPYINKKCSGGSYGFDQSQIKDIYLRNNIPHKSNRKISFIYSKADYEFNKRIEECEKYQYQPFSYIGVNSIAVYCKGNLVMVIDAEGFSYARYMLLPTIHTKKDTTKTLDWWMKNFEEYKEKEIVDDFTGKNPMKQYPIEDILVIDKDGNYTNKKAKTIKVGSKEITIKKTGNHLTKFNQKVKKLKFKVGDFITLKEPDKKFHTENHFYEIVKIENLYLIDENREQTNNYSEHYICKDYLKETEELNPYWDKDETICIATVAQNKYKLYKPTTKTSNEPKVIDFKPGVEKAEAKKTSKKAKTPKAPKVAKPSYKKAPYWYQILQKFKNMAGKEHKTTSSIQAFLTFLQDSCNSKLNRTTPHIETIRKIQDVVFPYANRLDKTYQDLPKWESLVNECKEAMSTITISKKTGVDPKFETVTLSGHKSKSKKKSKKCK